MPDTCPKCSAFWDADAIFCPSCAAPVKPKCPSCEKFISADAKFCKYCAFDLTQKAPVAKLEEFSAAASAIAKTLLPKPQPTSGTDALLTEKYHAMSDSQLLAMLRGDLSGQPEKSLFIASAELETRTKMDWRDIAVAKTRVKEAIIAAHTHGSLSAPTTVFRDEVSSSESRNRAFVILAIAVVVTLFAYFLVAPGNATIGYHLASVIFKLISYSIILLAIAAGIAAVKGKFRTHTLIVFGWLFLAAAIFDFGVAAYRKFVVEPEVRRTLEQIERRR